jgi:hypothetical protein
MGDNRRFHCRVYNGDKWQVYGLGLDHVCECDSDPIALMIAEALEAMADQLENKPADVLEHADGRGET